MDFDAVVLTSGGFGFSDDKGSLRARFAPWLAGLPTTNGSFATGDGVKLGEAVGATTVDMDKVQVHPTSFVDPADPANPVKFLAPEVLRGTGGLLVAPSSGKRFTDELGRRDQVSSAIYKHGSLLPHPDGHVDAHDNHYRAPGDPRPCFALLLTTEKTREALGSTFDFYLKYVPGAGAGLVFSRCDATLTPCLSFCCFWASAVQRKEVHHSGEERSGAGGVCRRRSSRCQHHGGHCCVQRRRCCWQVCVACF